MLLDYNNRLTPTAQAVTTTAVTTNSQPLPATGAELGDGEPIALVYTVTVAALVAGTETYEFQAVSATASDGTTGQIILASSGTFSVSGGAIAKGSLAAGTQVVVAIPPGSIPATATHIAGRIATANSAGITVLCDIVPVKAIGRFEAYTAQPSLQ